MQEKRPAGKRDLDSATKQEALRILRESFGNDVVIDSCKILSDEKRRNVLARIYLKSPAEEVPKCIIFKQSLPQKTDEDYVDATARFARDWAGLKFANNVDKSSHNVPMFFGGSPTHRFILIEDLGEKHVSLVDSLLVANNLKHAIPALERYMTALGKFHASSFNHTEEYQEILHGINNDARTPQAQLAFDAAKLSNGLESAHELLNISMTVDCSKEINKVMADLFNPKGPFTVVIHGDIAPDNVFDHEPPKGLQLIDFEHAAVRCALLDATYLRMSMPTGWCAKTLPNDVIKQLETLYRSELAKSIDSAKDDTKYNAAYTQACAFWALQEMAHLSNNFAKDNSWGRDPNMPKHLKWDAADNSGRSRFLSRLQAFIDVATEHDMLPNIRHMAQSMLDEVKKLKTWENAKPLDVYPAFNLKPAKEPLQAKEGPANRDNKDTSREHLQARYDAIAKKAVPHKPTHASSSVEPKPKQAETTYDSPTDKLKNPFPTKYTK